MVRGASCGATWGAVERVIDVAASEAPTRLGLEVQLLCKAKTASWDPLMGSKAALGAKNPIHFAGQVHRIALERAITAAEG